MRENPPRGTFQGEEEKNKEEQKLPFLALFPHHHHPVSFNCQNRKNRSKQVETALQQKPTAPIPTPPSSGKKYVFSNVSHQPKNFHDLDIDTLEKDRLGLKWMQFVILFMKHLPD